MVLVMLYGRVTKRRSLWCALLGIYLLNPLFGLYETDPDFPNQPLLLLSDVASSDASARGRPVPAIDRDNRNTTQAPISLNLVLTSATIPTALAAHLDT